MTEGKLVGTKQRQDDFFFTHTYICFQSFALHVDRALDTMGNKIRQVAYLLTAGLLVVMLIILPTISYSQDSIQYIPDGTEGELLEVVKADTVPQKWKDKRWRLFPGKLTTFKLGAALFYDYAGVQSRRQ